VLQCSVVSIDTRNPLYEGVLLHQNQRNRRRSVRVGEITLDGHSDVAGPSSFLKRRITVPTRFRYRLGHRAPV
jgi:hypothetical protein